MVTISIVVIGNTFNSYYIIAFIGVIVIIAAILRKKVIFKQWVD